MATTALSRNPESTDLLQSTKFRITFNYLPGMTFFCQSVNFPGVSLTEVVRNTPFVDLYVPGDKLVYDTLNFTFLVDEEMRAYTEIHDWMRGLTFPTEFEEYIDLVRKGQLIPRATGISSKDAAQYTDAVVTIYSNKNNPKFRIKFVDVFPTVLSPIIFNAQDTAENVVVADATFRFSYYNFEKIS